MQYVPVEPVESHDDKFFVKSENVPAAFYKNMEQVLQYYHEDYRWENQKLSISKEKWSDKDLMWNYTTKARDSNWLQEHTNK